MKCLKNRALVFDAGSMRFHEWNGHLRVLNTNLTKANVCDYYGFEIKNHEQYGLDPERKYRFLRSPEALENAVDSFRERPILYVHKAADADRLDNSKVIGTTGSDPSFSYPYIQNSITIWDGDYIEAIRNNTQAELSASYAFTPVMEDGVFEGESYDGVMTSIHVDHVALVEQGRAGPDVRVADERFGRKMPRLNKLGQKLVSALADFLKQRNQDGTGYTKISDAVASINGVHRKNAGKLLGAMLSDCSGVSDCSDVSSDRIMDFVSQILSQYGNGFSADDAAPLDTVSASDDDLDASEDVEDSIRKKGGKKLQASDAVLLERSIENRIMAKARQVQEARILVKPLVVEWAVTEDSGEEILRSVLEEMTGKIPPIPMGYEQLKYAVDLILLQKQQTRTSDMVGRVSSDELRRFGVARLRSI